MKASVKTLPTEIPDQIFDDEVEKIHGESVEPLITIPLGEDPKKAVQIG